MRSLSTNTQRLKIYKIMKKIRLFALLIGALALMPSCKKDKNEAEQVEEAPIANIEVNDSLETVLAEKDSLMALVNEVGEAMTQIMQLQDIISVQDLSQETPERKKQLQHDIELIKQSIVDRQKRVSELEKRLAQSTNYTDEMKRTIKSLKDQLATQQSTIETLTSQLAAAHIEIKDLNQKVDSLSNANTQVKKEKEKVQQENTQLANDMNVCYYVVGSKKELKKNRIIETGFLRKTRIMEGDYEKSYFTKADKRTLSRIPLHSKKVELMSKHPAGSYEIIEHDGAKTLVITNPNKFWELSNFLIVKID